MSAQLLAHAMAVAYNPNSSTDQLRDALGDLVTFGALDAADKVLGRLRAAGESLTLVTRMERVVAWFRTLGPTFEDRALLGAIGIVHRDDVSDQQLLTAAESLVVWGSPDEADAALARLAERGVVSGRTARLGAASRQLRRSGIMKEVSALSSRTSLNKPYEVLVRRRSGSTRTIVVFTGVALRFWLSLNALHVFLRRLDANVIYLSDHTAAMYVNGLQSIGPGYGPMIEMLRKEIAKLHTTSLHVLATSAGGFAGLRAALDLEADTFAGMSIRSDLSPTSSIRMSVFERYVIKVCRYPEMLVDLRPLVERSDFPRRILLYTGDHSKTDIAHTNNLRGIPRVDITQIENCRQHDVVSDMIARGTFMQMLARLIE